MGIIFVSSTFRDMHEERDAIRNYVAGKVNAAAHRYGQHVYFEDLRWGVDTQGMEEDAASRKVLDVCLDEIERSDPPMVVLLGDRYGWMPGIGPDGVKTSSTLIADAAKRKGLELESDLISVTALEVEYGTLKAEGGRELDACFFFRSIERDGMSKELRETYEGEADDVYRNKRERLHARVVEACAYDGESGRGEKHDYELSFKGGKTQLGDFADTLAQRVVEALEPTWKELDEMNPLKRTVLQHKSFMKEKGGLFGARIDERDRLIDELADKEGSARLVLKGDPGLGKTTLLASAGLELEQTLGKNLLFLSCGFTPDTSDATGVLRVVVWWLADLLEDGAAGKVPSMNVQALEQELARLCEGLAAKNQRVVLLVDAADQLLPGEDRDRLVFLPQHAAVSYCMTCTNDFGVGNRAYRTLEPLPPGEERQRAVKALRDVGGWSELPQGAVDALLAKDGAGKPLYLSMVMQALLMLTRTDYSEIERTTAQGSAAPDAIDGHLAGLVESFPSDLGSMAAKLVMDAVERIEGAGKGDGGQTPLGFAVECLAASRRGLRRDDLERLVEERFGGDEHLGDLPVAQLVCYYDNSFITREDGRIDFAHKSIREGLRASMSEAHVRDLHCRVVKVLDAYGTDDPVRSEELVYHAFHARSALSLFRYIATCEKPGPDATNNERRRWQAATRDFRACCGDANHARWVAGEIEKQCGDETGVGIVEFVSDGAYAFQAIGALDLNTLRTAVLVLNANRKLAEACCDRAGDVDADERLAQAWFGKAYALQLIGKERTPEAVQAFREAYALRKKNKDEGEEQREQYARGCDNLATNLLRAMDEGAKIDLDVLGVDERLHADAPADFENVIMGLFRAEYETRKALLACANDGNRAARRENYAWACSNYASKGLKIFPSTVPNEGASLLEEACQCRKDNLEAHEAVEGSGAIRAGFEADAERYAYSCRELAKVLVEQDEQLKRAWECAEQAREYRESIARSAVANPKRIRELAEAYGTCAQVAHKRGEWAQAVESAEKALDQALEAYWWQGTDDCRRVLAEICLLSVDIFTQEPANTGAAAGDVWSSGVLHEAIGILEGAQEQGRSDDTTDTLVKCYDKLIAFYRAQGRNVEMLERRRGRAKR